MQLLSHLEGETEAAGALLESLDAPHDIGSSLNVIEVRRAQTKTDTARAYLHVVVDDFLTTAFLQLP